MNPDALSASPLLSLIGWTAIAAFALGAAAAALALIARAVAPRLAPTWTHRLVLLLYLLSLAAAVLVAGMPRRPQTSPTIQPGLPLAGALLPVPPGPAPEAFGLAIANRSDAVGIIVSLVGILSTGLAALAIARLCLGLWAIRRLRRHAVPVTDTSALALVESVAVRLGVRRRVGLRESQDVDTAITGGWLRPFILLPPGLREELGSEIEAVFAHELAHVQRMDFAVAVVQAVADAATTLSPGHRRLSREAGLLREQACDDVVLRLGIGRLRYARALEALGKWSRGIPVTHVVCAANRDLATRVRRLLDPSATKLDALVVAGAAIVLCVGAAATTLVAVAAPGLPMPPGSSALATAPRALMSGLDAVPPAQRKSAVTVDYYYNPEMPGPFRVSSLTFHNDDTVTATIKCVYPKRIVALALGREARRTPALSAGDQFVERSAVVKVMIDPGKSTSASLVFPPITLSSLFMGPRAKGSRVQAQYYPAYARFEDGTEWSGGPAVARLQTIPRALVSRSVQPSSSPGDRIWICYDAEGHETSEGGVAPIREDQNQWVRCTNGRWVPTTLPVPAGAKVTPLPIG